MGPSADKSDEFLRSAGSFSDILSLVKRIFVRRVRAETRRFEVGMEGSGYLAAAMLACVFAWAGTSKLRHSDRAAEAFRGIGLPAPETTSRAVAVLELALALLLVTVPNLGGIVALIFLAAFSAVLVQSIRSGLEVECGCFGSARHQPVSWVELVRNALLAAMAVGAMAAGPPVFPSIPEAVLVTSAVASGALILALCDLRREAGAVLGTRRAWERVNPA